MPTDEYTEFAAKLEAGIIRLPSGPTIYKARSKLDWMCMLYQQRLSNIDIFT